MEQEILNQLEEILYKKYKSLQNGFIFIENYDGIIVLNWSPINDTNVSYKRIEQIKLFMHKQLINKKQAMPKLSGSYLIK